MTVTSATTAAWTVVAEWAPFQPDCVALDRNSSHIAAMHCQVARELGKAAARGLFDRAGFERILRRWCRIQPGLRGASVDSLCCIFDQSEKHENETVALAEYHVHRAVAPLFDVHAPADEIEAAAVKAAGNNLDGCEIVPILRAELGQWRAFRRRRRCSR